VVLRIGGGAGPMQHPQCRSTSSEREKLTPRLSVLLLGRDPTAVMTSPKRTCCLVPGGLDTDLELTLLVTISRAVCMLTPASSTRTYLTTLDPTGVRSSPGRPRVPRLLIFSSRNLFTVSPYSWRPLFIAGQRRIHFREDPARSSRVIVLLDLQLPVPQIIDLGVSRSGGQRPAHPHCPRSRTHHLARTHLDQEPPGGQPELQPAGEFPVLDMGVDGTTTGEKTG